MIGSRIIKKNKKQKPERVRARTVKGIFTTVEKFDYGLYIKYIIISRMNFLRGLISFGLRRFILKNIMRSATYLEIVQGEISVHVERKYCCKM